MKKIISIIGICALIAEINAFANEDPIKLHDNNSVIKSLVGWQQSNEVVVWTEFTNKYGSWNASACFWQTN